MTEVREHIRSATQAYRAARYPGDLAAELLPRPSSMTRLFTGRNGILVSGIGASAVAAVVLVSLFLTRGANLQPVERARTAERGLAGWLPISPDKVPLPRFEAPSLPVRPPELRLPLHMAPGVEAYQDLAMQYRELQLNEHLRRTTVPTIPVDLPTRGVEWIQKVWTGDKSA